MKTHELARIIFIVDKLKKLSRSINRIDCQLCNGFKTEKESSKVEQRRYKLINEAKELAKGLGLYIYHQSDPRGCSLYLINKIMDENTYNHGVALC